VKAITEIDCPEIILAVIHVERQNILLEIVGKRMDKIIIIVIITI
jgi:hypothetical protein